MHHGGERHAQTSRPKLGSARPLTVGPNQGDLQENNKVLSLRMKWPLTPEYGDRDKVLLSSVSPCWDLGAVGRTLDVTGSLSLSTVSTWVLSVRVGRYLAHAPFDVNIGPCRRDLFHQRRNMLSGMLLAGLLLIKSSTIRNY